jgi:type II secretory pathway pseudopilin PulG
MNLSMAHRDQRSETGFALVEVIVAAAVLAIVALAVLSGIDGANSASAREKARAVAANLAEQDQERLRSMPVEILRNPPQSGDVTVDGVAYQITSEAKWITDDLGGEPTCGKDSNQLEYLHIITTVKSTLVGKQIPPVTVDSLVAPTTEWAEDHGTLGVRVVDRTTTKGVPGISVRVSSADYSPSNVVTDGSGCAVFKSMPVDSYTITIDQSPYLDRNLVQKSVANQTVVAKKVSFVTLQYDKATSARVAVTTHIPGKPYATTEAKTSKAKAVSLTNGAFVGMKRTVTSASPASSFDATSLYPYYENSYTFFTGTCGYASPDTYKPANTNYFSQTNTAAALLADPAKIQPQGVTVRQPPIAIRVKTKRGTTSSPNNTSGTYSDGDTKLRVFAQLQQPSTSTEDCDEPVYELAPKAWPGGVWGTSAPGSKPNDHWLSQLGTDFDPGLPFGKYKICVLDSTQTTRYGAMYGGTTNPTLYDNTVPDGGAVTELDPVAWSWTSGQNCWQ